MVLIRLYTDFVGANSDLIQIQTNSLRFCKNIKKLQVVLTTNYVTTKRLPMPKS